MSIEIVDGSFLERFEELLGIRRATVWLASPFLSYRMAQWLAALPASRHGDRRLLVSWAAKSIDSFFLSAHAVSLLRASGFVVRDLPRLHAKVVVAGARAYFGSGNLTFYGLDAGNTEIGVFARGSSAAAAKALFDAWWGQAVLLSDEQIEKAKDRQERLAKRRRRPLDYEVQPGRQPPQVKPRQLPVGGLDASPAIAASPPAITHFWTRETIAENLDLVGHRHASFESASRMARGIRAGTRVYSVGWAPPRGLFVLNAFTVTQVRKRRSGWLVSGADATPLEFNRVLRGQDYERSVRLRSGRSAPNYHMAFAPIAYLSQRTANRLARLVSNGDGGHSGARPPRCWIKQLHYRHDAWTIAPDKEHWISDPGQRDDNGHRIFRRDGSPAGKPSYRVGDLVGLYFGTTLRVPLVVEVIGLPRFDPEFVQKNSDGKEPDAGERWPWMTPIRGVLRVPLDQAPDIDRLGIQRGPINRGLAHFKLSPEQYQGLVAALSS